MYSTCPGGCTSNFCRSSLVSSTSKIHYSAMRGSVAGVNNRCIIRIHTGSNKLQLRVLNLNSFLLTPINSNTCLCTTVIYFPKHVKRFCKLSLELFRAGKCIFKVNKSSRCTPAVMRFKNCSRNYWGLFVGKMIDNYMFLINRLKVFLFLNGKTSQIEMKTVQAVC